MRRFHLVFGLAVGLGAAAVVAQQSGERPAGGGAFSGGIPGPEIVADEPAVEITREEIYLPDTPAYVAARSERLNQAWESLSEKLNRPVSLDVKNATFRSVLGQIAEQIEAPLWIDDEALTDEGIAIDDPIAFHRDAVSAETAFKQLLTPRGLSVLIDGESLAVTTLADERETFITRVYPVPDLVAMLVNGQTRAEFDGLIELIKETTGTYWFEIDGVGGTIAPLSQGGVYAVVVAQDYRHHRDIEKLLYDLRQSRAPAVKGALTRSAGEARPRGRSPVRTDDLPPSIRERLESLRQDSTLPPSLRERLEQFRKRSGDAEDAPAGAAEEVSPAPDRRDDQDTTVVVPIPGAAPKAPKVRSGSTIPKADGER